MKLAAAALILLAAVGAVVAVAAGDSTAATVVAIVLIGCAAVGAVSLAFYSVGQAEDRDRAEAERLAAERRPDAQSGNGKPPEDPHPRTLGLDPGRRRPRPPRRPQ